MRIDQRAAQIWPVLVLAAINRQILTYEQVAQLIGIPRVAMGSVLAPIQAYCQVHNLPPLTVLVVSKETGMPGGGFTASADIPRAQAMVFGSPWLEHGCPTPEAFQEAVKRPATGE